MTLPISTLKQRIDAHPYRLLFATISGAHLYGFPSPDSDFDLRGVHLLPLREVVGLHTGPETVEKSGIHDGLEIDLVTHDAKIGARCHRTIQMADGVIANEVTQEQMIRIAARAH